MPSEPVALPAALARALETIEKNAQRRKDAAAEIAAAEEQVRRVAAERMKLGAVPHLRACGVDEVTAAAAASPQESPVVTWLRGWLAGEKPIAVLTGGFGAGKSVGAAWTLLQAQRWTRTHAHPMADEPVAFPELDSRRGLWVTAARLHFASRFAEGRERSLVDRAAMVEWLVLDELREADGRGAGRERLEEVLGERYAMRRRTVITTNLGIEGLKGVIGERLASRFAEGAAGFDAGDVDLRRVAP